MVENKTGFAADVSTEEIQRRIFKLLESKQLQELDLLLQELHRRKLALRARILMEMTPFGEIPE